MLRSQAVLAESEVEAAGAHLQVTGGSITVHF
jgi:hypothetical protein